MTTSRRSQALATRLRIAREEDQQREALRRYGVVSPYELQLHVDTHPDFSGTNRALLPVDPDAPVIHIGASVDRFRRR